MCIRDRSAQHFRQRRRVLNSARANVLQANARKPLPNCTTACRRCADVRKLPASESSVRVACL
eukprot:6986699-Alexandrium_andersonii.AAC.1